MKSEVVRFRICGQWSVDAPRDPGVEQPDQRAPIPVVGSGSATISFDLIDANTVGQAFRQLPSYADMRDLQRAAILIVAGGALSEKEARELECEVQPQVETVMEQTMIWDLDIEYGSGEAWGRYSALSFPSGTFVFLTWTDYLDFEIDICDPGGPEAIVAHTKWHLLQRFEGSTWMTEDAFLSSGFEFVGGESYPVDDPAFWNEVLGLGDQTALAD